MTPYEQAARAHQAPPSFREAIEAHAYCGHVLITPALFVLARRVHSSWEPERIYDPWLTDPEGDTWHVWLAAGDMNEALRLMPYPLPWIGYEHRGRLRIINANRLLLHKSCVCGFLAHGLRTEGADSIHPAAACCAEGERCTAGS
jgi:hypothetical protein